MWINLLFGFLGSGKTTLARRLLAEPSRSERMAIIVNEFGDVGIDGTILEGRDVDMVELTSGCLCCTLKGSLVNAVEEVHTRAGADRVIIEATGVAQPEEMMETFAEPSVRAAYHLAPMVTVVDTPKFDRLRDMLGEFYGAQVETADIVVLNKIDLAATDDLEAVRREVATLNPHAAVIFTEQCELDHELLFSAKPSEAMARFLAAHGVEGHRGEAHHHESDHASAPAESFVADADEATTRAAVECFFARLPDNVWRVKGFMTLDGEPALIQYATGQLDISPAPAKRHRHLVFIGRDMDRADIESRLAALGEGSV